MEQILETAIGRAGYVCPLPEPEILQGVQYSPVRSSGRAVARVSDGLLFKRGNRLLKRGFDVIVSAFFMLTVLSWMVPLLWLINRLAYRQGVFFVQLRNGLNDQVFACIKFKTMRDSEEAHVRSAEPNDPRVTPLGHFLRNTGLDELPQFVNIFLGHMSVIGPRPHMLFHTERYTELVPHFMERHTVKPGLTGLAQVNGFRGSIRTLRHLHQRVRLDLHYIENWSFMMDLKIFVLTIISIFKGGSGTF